MSKKKRLLIPISNSKERTHPETVYVVANPSHNFYKIGKTINFKHRMYSLNNTSVPLDYYPVLLFEPLKKNNTRNLEKELHDIFDKKRLRNDREFFTLTKTDLRNIIDLASSVGYNCVYENKAELEYTDLCGLMLEKGYFKDEKEFNDWFCLLDSVLDEIEDWNGSVEYNLMQERGEGYICPDEDEGIYDENAIEYIINEIGGTSEMVEIVLHEFGYMDCLIRKDYYEGAYDL